MAMSTIFEDIVLKTEEEVERFLEALEQSKQDVASKTSVGVEYIEDEETLNTFIDKVLNVSEYIPQ